MHLAAGTRLGPYAIESLVGAGGMGEVYRARDTRLDRTVALKILSPVLAAHPDLRDRFEREARAISTLAHPNICTLFDLGRESGTDYIVMEFLDGETLASRLERGAIPFDHALSIGVDIISALEAAHRRGIVHRDLKPGNIVLVRRTGLSGTPAAKLLDFGLAKLAVEAAPSGSQMTTARPLTEHGTILGTFQYMAPEQLEGADADARSDIFAFGAMFYEMLTGRRAFHGKSQASLIGAILKEQPPAVSTIQAVSPPAVDRIVARCLAKDPDERWQTASDLAAELRWVQQGNGPTGSIAGGSPRAAGRWREAAAWVLAAAGLTAAALMIVLGPRRSAVADALRFTIDDPPEAPFTTAPVAPFPAVSPDGKRIVYVTRNGSTVQLALRSFAATPVQLLSGTDGAALPFWSPDSRFIAYAAAGKLLRYDMTTSTAHAIGDAAAFEGGTWNRDGTILFGTVTGGLSKISVATGQLEPVTTLDRAKGETSHRWPVFMPDGRHYLFIVQPGNIIRFGSLGSNDAKDIAKTESRAVYSNAGYVLYGIQNVLKARAFDPVRGELSGEAVSIADNVRMLPNNARATYSVSDNGILVYRTGMNAAVTHLQWYDRAGKPQSEVVPFGDNRSLSLSPDGSRVAFHKHDTGSAVGGVWIKDLTRGTIERATFDFHSYGEVWHPDGRHIAFASSPSTGNTASTTLPAATASLTGISVTAANGTGDVEPLVTTPGANWPNWSPDGKVLIYQVGSIPAGQTDIWVMPMTTRQPIPYIHGAANEADPAFSPDGKWVAYASDETGRPEVYVQPYPANGDKWTISTSGGAQPQWRSDGKELFFLSASLQVDAVDVALKNGRFDAGVPHPLFAVRPTLFAGLLSPYRCYAVSPDGQSFLIDETAPSGSDRYDPLTVIVNWMALLRR